MHDIKTSGIYYLTGGVTDKPVDAGGFYTVSAYNDGLIVGEYISFANEHYTVSFIDNQWTYAKSPTKTEIDTLSNNAYMLTGVKNIPNNTNVNKTVTPGVYNIKFVIDAETMTNLPVVAAGILIVEKAGYASANYWRQIFKPYNNNDVYTRNTTNNGSAWTAWAQQPTREEIDRYAGYLKLNLNEAITTGIYSMNGSTANAPGSKYGTVIVEYGGAMPYSLANSWWIDQIACDSNNNVFLRRYTGGENGYWRDWVKLPSRAEMDFVTRNLGNPNTAGFHNAIYRGNNITSFLTDGSLWDRIKGTNGYALFDDLFLGDYITVGSNSYAIVDFDYYLRTGIVDVTEHHIVMMPVGNMNIPAGTVLYGSSDTLTLLNGDDVTYKETATAFKWNAAAEAPNANNTNGGYKFSRMRTVIMKAADTIVVNAFGASHVKPITVMYPNPSDASASGLASGWVWFDKDDWSDPLRKSICDLPNETQIYGQQVFGRGSAYTNVGLEIGVDKFQFALCGLQKNFVNNRANYWLRSVGSAGGAAALVSNVGSANTLGSTYALGVRPRFVLVG